MCTCMQTDNQCLHQATNHKKPLTITNTRTHFQMNAILLCLRIQAVSWSDGSYRMEGEEEDSCLSFDDMMCAEHIEEKKASRIISRYAQIFDKVEEKDDVEEGKDENVEGFVRGAGSSGREVKVSGREKKGGMSARKAVQRERDGRGDGQVQILYIQMEYCEKTLSDVISNEKLMTTPERLWNLFRQLVAGIAYIHSKGIVHRDLKPKNVFLDFSGDIKIGDLGLARFSAGHRKGDNLDVGDVDDPLAKDEAEEHAETASSTGEMGGQLLGKVHSPALSAMVESQSQDLSSQVGTYLYLAPEVLHGGWDEDQSKRDLFALGIVLFEMWSNFDTLMERIVTLQVLC